MQNECGAQVGRRRPLWVVQIARSLEGFPGPRTYRRAWVLSDQIDAQASDYGIGVVLVQSVEDEAVVQQRRGLVEHLSSHLEVDIWPRVSNCIGSRHELLEGWTWLARRHTASLASGPPLGKRLARRRRLSPRAVSPTTREREQRGRGPIAGHDRGNALDHEARIAGDHVGRARAERGPKRVHT